MASSSTLFLALLGLAACRSHAGAAEGGAVHEPVNAPLATESPASPPLPPLDGKLAEQTPLGPHSAAVVELFTSEGCSSCPAADETLADITAEEERAGHRVYTLELHVDYWNDLGWVDPFSAPVHSERQRGYAHALGVNGIYTPQMVVNGRAELVGSRGAEARSAIERALARPSSVGVSVFGARVKDAPGVIQVQYRVSSAAAVNLQLALAEDATQTKVAGGENAGRTLKHRHVVRSFWTGRVAGNAQGTWRASWPASAQNSRAFVVAYAADPGTLAIIGADGQELRVPD